MVGVCCGCIAKPASVQPRKTYNTLVGQLFAGTPIATDESIDSSTRRKIQKLQEYVQVNPAKIPKVSRRLMRRIKATLLKPGNNLGHVKVAVHAYAYMLARACDDTSSYSPAFFARELVSGQDAVVPLLLRDLHMEMRTLGAELLAVFTKVQSQVDNKLGAIQALTPLVCRAAQAALSADRKEQKLQQAVQRRRAGDKLAVPNPLDLVARRDPAHVAALEVSCLRCLGEVVSLCQRSKVLPEHLSEVQAVMLDNLRVPERASHSGNGELAPTNSGDHEPPAATAAAAAPPGPGAGSVVDAGFYSALGVAKAVPAGWQARALAVTLLQLMGSFTRDIATVHTILDSFYGYMDETHRWQEAAIVQDFAQMLLNSGSQHQFLMYASLLRHASSPKLGHGDCGVVLQLAAQQGCRLDDTYSLAVLAAALHEVPRAWAAQASRAPRAMPLQTFLDLFRAGTAAVKERHTSVSDAAGGPSVSIAGGASASGTAPPPALSGAGAGSVSSGERGEGAAFKQQMAQLKEAMLVAVRQLAARLGSAAELCEALTAALGTAAAQLGLPTADGVGIAADAPASSSAGGDTAAATAAVMSIECAAAAADAFAQQCGGASPRVQLVLPGGVLPASLVAAVLPLLRSAPALIRRTVQGMLLALLPAAEHGVASDKRAGQLADAAVREAQRLAHDDEESGPAQFAAADALLRCSLRGPQPRPQAALQAGRWLLQQQQHWQEAGYRSAGSSSSSSSVVRAHAVLLQYNSLLAALAEATGSSELQAQQLPLEALASPALYVTASGLLATGAPFDAAASKAALAALEQQQPATQEQGQALHAALLQAPRLVAEFGDQLQPLLHETLSARRSAPSGDGGKAQLSDKVNLLLTKRMSTLRKDLVHVSELMRDSLTRVHDLPSASALAASTRPSADGHAARGSAEPGASRLSAGAAAAALAAAAGAAVDAGDGDRDLPSPVDARQPVLGASEVAGGGSGSRPCSPQAAAAARPQSPLGKGESAARAGGGSGSSSSLSAKVAALLAQPPPAGAYVVRDVAISRLAGQLEPS